MIKCASLKSAAANGTPLALFMNG